MATIQCPHCSHKLTLPSAPSAGGLNCPQCQRLFAISSGSAPAVSSIHSKASDTFDPYYNWLGIPPHDQPPHHYRLLGLELFEANSNVIDNAANRQSAHLRTCSLGARAAFAQELLNQVAAARICLLAETRKAEYDARLRSQIAPSTPASTAQHESNLPITSSLGVSSRPKSARSKNSTVEVLKIVLGGIAGLAAGYVLLLVFFPDLIKLQPKSAKVVPHTTSRQSATASKTPQEKSFPSTLRPKSKIPPVPVGIGRASTPPAITDGNQPAHHPRAVIRTPQPKPADAVVSEENKADENPDSSPAKSPPPARSPADLAQPSIPAPVADTDQFPTSVALPPSDATNWLTLVPLSNGPDKVELISAFDPAVAKVSLSLEAAVGCDANSWWIKFEVAAADQAKSVEGTLAEIQIEPSSGDLQFRWQTGNSIAAAALANSWLKFDFESRIRFLAMRRPLVVVPLKLDFEKERVILPLVVDSIPATDQLYLDLTPLTGLPSSAIFRNGVGQAKLDREVVIEFSDMPGAQIGVKLAKVPQAPLGLIIEPRFKDGPSREFDLTFAQLEKTQRASMEAVQEAKGKIRGLSSNLSSAQSDLKSAQGRSVKNLNQAKQKAFDTARLEGIVRDANRRLVAMREQEAGAQSRLNNVPKILAFMRSLHGKEIPFRVVVKASVAELALAEGIIGGGAK